MRNRFLGAGSKTFEYTLLLFYIKMEAQSMFSEKGAKLLVVNNFKFSKAFVSKCGKIRWRCVNTKQKCQAKIYTGPDEKFVLEAVHDHNHQCDENISRQAVSNYLKQKAIEDITESPSKIIQKELIDKDWASEIGSNDLERFRKNIYGARRSRTTAHQKKSDDSSEAETSSRLDDNAVPEETDPLQNTSFIAEQYEIKPEIGDYKITSPSTPLHFTDIREAMAEETSTEVRMELAEFETTTPITSSDNPAEIVQVPKRQKTSKTNQNGVDDKVANAMEAVVDCLGNIYPETSIGAFGNYVASTLKDFPKAEMHKAKQEIMGILAKYQELLNTQCKEKSDTPETEKAPRLHGSAVSQDFESFQSIYIKEEIEDKSETGDSETAPSQKRPRSPDIEEATEDEMLPSVPEPFESITTVPNISSGNPEQIADVPKRQKTSKNNQNSVDDKVVNAMEAVVDCLRNIYPEASIDAFGNYVACALKEFPMFKRHKARQEILGILTKYQVLLDT